MCWQLWRSRWAEPQLICFTRWEGTFWRAEALSTWRWAYLSFKSAFMCVTRTVAFAMFAGAAKSHQESHLYPWENMPPQNIAKRAMLKTFLDLVMVVAIETWPFVVDGCTSHRVESTKSLELHPVRLSRFAMHSFSPITSGYQLILFWEEGTFKRPLVAKIDTWKPLWSFLKPTGKGTGVMKLRFKMITGNLTPTEEISREHRLGVSNIHSVLSHCLCIHSVT